MTQAQPPVLDRLVTRTLTMVSPPAGTPYSYTTRTDDDTPSNLGGGRYHVNSETEIEIANRVDGGQPFPDSVYEGDTLMLAWAGYQVRVTVTNIRASLPPAFNDVWEWRIAFSPALDLSQVPAIGAADTSLTVTVSGGTPTTETVTRKVWAGRLALRNEEQLSILAGSIEQVTSVRSYVVRHDPVNEWAVAEVFRDEAGDTRTVLSIAEHGGRERYLRLLTN